MRFVCAWLAHGVDLQPAEINSISTNTLCAWQELPVLTKEERAQQPMISIQTSSRLPTLLQQPLMALIWTAFN